MTVIPFYGFVNPRLPQRKWTRAEDFRIREKGEKLLAVSNFTDRAYFLKTGERCKLS